MSTLTEQQKPKRNYRRKPQPVCPRCGVPMRVGSTLESIRYCYCPVPGCRESAKQERE